MRLKLEDLPSEYQQQIRDKIAVSTSKPQHAKTIDIPVRDAKDSRADSQKSKVPNFVFPVQIRIHSVRKRLTDSDGVSAKEVIDGLVLAGLLPNDSPKYVWPTPVQTQEEGEPEETVITIEWEQDDHGGKPSSLDLPKVREN